MSSTRPCMRSASSSSASSTRSAARFSKYAVKSWLVNALSVPPFLRIRRENVPLGYLAVPLNIMCSSMWESPARPMTSLREPTLYQTCTVATGALGTSTNSTFMPLERICSWGSAAAGGTEKSTSEVTVSNQKIMCRKSKQIMFRGEEGRCMLTTRFNLCQGSSLVRGRKMSELAAGSQYVAAATLSDEYVDAGLSPDRL